MMEEDEALAVLWMYHAGHRLPFAWYDPGCYYWEGPASVGAYWDTFRVGWVEMEAGDGQSCA